MSPIQQMLLGVGAVATKTYVDDVFSTFLYEGNETQNRSITNSINLSGEGGLVWLKARSVGRTHLLYDTERGASKPIESSGTSAEWTNTSLGVVQFNNNGFNLGSHQSGNWNGEDFSSWTFRKAPGFFTIKEYTGSGSTQSISHDLGSIPGCIMVKRTDTSADWGVYHRGQNGGVDPEDYRLRLNSTTSENNDTYWGDTAPTATHFTVGDSHTEVNASGGTYIAYIFAGGESTAATARSLTFDGSYDSLQLASSSDFNFGTGDFTFEGWLKPNNNTDFQVFLNWGSDNPSIAISNDNNSFIYYNSTVNSKTAGIAAVGQWTHYAISRSSGTTRLFLNGELKNSFSDSHNYGAQALSIGAYINGNDSWNGSISNVRIVKGTAVYTSSFRPPTEPLTNITNTVLLCCNNSSTTGSTVTPGTITAENNVTASTDSPFDDPAGFAFGDAGDQNVIKCGSYVGTGSAGIEVNIGFEPQLILVKSTASGENWEIYDSMRGIVDGLNQSDRRLRPNTSDAEDDNPGFFSLRPNGFIVNGTSGSVNQNGVTFVFLAIRRPDGYVGKPVELGTGVFAMDTGGSSSTIPNYDSGFPVDFAIYKTVASSGHAFWVHSRLTQGKELQTNSSSGQSDWANGTFDSNTGWSKDGAAATVQSWMWKRHAGFDVVTYTGDGVAGRSIFHSLNATPEMIWLKERNSTHNWYVYHKGMNGGTDPEDYYMFLNTTAAEDNYTIWNDTAPTSTHFTVSNYGEVNGNNDTYIAMLFASVDGISKVGSYDGDSSNNISLTLGFTPRLLIIKSTTDTTGWVVMDSLRDSYAKQLQLNSSAAQNTDSNHLIVSMNSTTTVLEPNKPDTSASNEKYIYYAHA